jgi:hypothetical protein
VTTRRRLLLVAACGLALLLAWRGWSPGRAGVSGTDGASAQAGARSTASSPRASHQPAHAHPAARPTAPAPTAARTGIAACDRFVERTMACSQLPADARIAVAEASEAWAKLTAAGPRPDLEATCRATASVQGESLAAMGC